MSFKLNTVICVIITRLLRFLFVLANLFRLEFSIFDFSPLLRTRWFCAWHNTQTKQKQTNKNTIRFRLRCLSLFFFFVATDLKCAGASATYKKLRPFRELAVDQLNAESGERKTKPSQKRATERQSSKAMGAFCSTANCRLKWVWIYEAVMSESQKIKKKNY